MTLTQLDVARASYLWALQQHTQTVEDQLADVARVIRSLEQACSANDQTQAAQRAFRVMSARLDEGDRLPIC